MILQKKFTLFVLIYFFWTGEPCNEVLRTKRSDLREKILKEGVKNIFKYIIMKKNHIL